MNLEGSEQNKTQLTTLQRDDGASETGKREAEVKTLYVRECKTIVMLFCAFRLSFSWTIIFKIIALHAYVLFDPVLLPSITLLLRLLDSIPNHPLDHANNDVAPAWGKSIWYLIWSNLKFIHYLRTERFGSEIYCKSALAKKYNFHAINISFLSNVFSFGISMNWLWNSFKKLVQKTLPSRDVE